VDLYSSETILESHAQMKEEADAAAAAQRQADQETAQQAAMQQAATQQAAIRQAAIQQATAQQAAIPQAIPVGKQSTGSGASYLNVNASDDEDEVATTEQVLKGACDPVMDIDVWTEDTGGMQYGLFAEQLLSAYEKSFPSDYSQFLQSFGSSLLGHVDSISALDEAADGNEVFMRALEVEEIRVESNFVQEVLEIHTSAFSKAKLSTSVQSLFKVWMSQLNKNKFDVASMRKLVAFTRENLKKSETS